jgi:RNA polymerase sigma factor (sigma-70 family)
MDTLSDNLLIELYNETHNNDYFAELYTRYYQSVYARCLRYLHDSMATEDSVQEIFIKAERNLTNYRRQSQFKTWLFSIAINYCNDQLRLTKKQKSTFTDVDPNTLNVSLESGVAAENELNLLRVNYALAQLSPSEQNLLRMKYQDLVSLKEIALQSGMSYSAVKMRLLRSKEKFRRNYLKCIQEDLVPGQAELYLVQF